MVDYLSPEVVATGAGATAIGAAVAKALLQHRTGDLERRVSELERWRVADMTPVLEGIGRLRGTVEAIAANVAALLARAMGPDAGGAK